MTVSVTGTQKDMYAGTTADVSIIVKQVQNVLTVPTQALSTSGGKTYVMKVVGSSTKRTAVTIGETYGASTEIIKGLASGDKVQVTTIQRAQTGGGNAGGGGQTGGGFGGGGFAPGGPAGGGEQ